MFRFNNRNAVIGLGGGIICLQSLIYSAGFHYQAPPLGLSDSKDDPGEQKAKLLYFLQLDLLRTTKPKSKSGMQGNYIQDA